MNNFYRISLYTIQDHLKHKSFYILLGISLFFVFLIRNCNGENLAVNGQQIDSITVTKLALKTTFHTVATGMFIMVIMLSMRMFSRDKEDGSMVLFLSRSVRRWQYLIGRICGTWVLSTLFMFILHLTIFIIAKLNTGQIVSGYLFASLLCSINLFLIILLVSLLAFYIPDFIAALLTLVVIGIGFLSDGFHQLMQSDFAKTVTSESIKSEPAFWRVLYPKMLSLQQYAATLIDNSAFTIMGKIHPLVNVFFYIVLLTGILILIFNKREI